MTVTERGKTRPGASGRIAVVLRTCTGCGACVAPCGPRAVTLVSERPGGFGEKRAVIDPDRCTGCGDCIPACPHLAIVLRPRLASDDARRSG